MNLNPMNTYRRLRAEADERSRMVQTKIPTIYRFGLGPINCFSQYTIAPDTGETVATHWFCVDRLSAGLVVAKTVFTNNDRPVRLALDLSRGFRLYGGRFCLMLTRVRKSKPVTS